MKRLLQVISFCICSVYTMADDVATNWMILNNSNSQQYSDIWKRFRAGFRLDHSQNDRVKYYERLYTKSPKAFNKMMANATPYLYFLLNEVERNGMPAEVALIPGVETTYNPLAQNPTDAYAGMWQFVPSTGRRFNMVQNSDIDERRDIIKSTRAALSYLNYLYAMFGQWDVAIGAFNWGEGGMYKAVLNSGMPLGAVDYSDLQLRQITADYVPKIIALANIIEDPGKFGVTLDNVPNEPYFAMVTTVANSSVADVYKLSSIDNSLFTKLNGQYKDLTYQLNVTNDVLLPVNNQNIYYASAGQALIMANNIRLAGNDAQSAQTLSIDLNLKPAALTVPIESTVPGGTVADAQLPAATQNDDLDTLLDSIDSGNQASQNTNAGAQSVSITASTTDTTAVALSATQNSPVKYTVNQGDTLYSIAKKFNADINQIRTDNNIPGNNLSAGQVLTIKPNSAAVAHST